MFMLSGPLKPANKWPQTTTHARGPRDHVSICYHINIYCLRKFTIITGKF